MGIDINIRVAGGAGQGVHTAGGLLCRLAVASGHHFHATQDYMSRIRGGRNSYSVRIREIPVRAGRPLADIVLSLDPGLSRTSCLRSTRRASSSATSRRERRGARTRE